MSNESSILDQYPNGGTQLRHIPVRNVYGAQVVPISDVYSAVGKRLTRPRQYVLTCTLPAYILTTTDGVISAAGPPPIESQLKARTYRMLANYCKWCLILKDTFLSGIMGDSLPTTACAAWSLVSDPRGGAIRGVKAAIGVFASIPYEAERGPSKEDIRLVRLDALKHIFSSLKPHLAPVSLDSASRFKDEMEQYFGHCAETLMLLRCVLLLFS